VISIHSVKSYCVLKTNEIKEEIQYILKFYYKKRNNATQAVKKICEKCLWTQYQYVWYFKRFQSENFDVKDASRSDRPITGKVDEIMEKVEQDRHISNRDIGKELNIDHKTVLNYLEKTGYKKQT